MLKNLNITVADDDKIHVPYIKYILQKLTWYDSIDKDFYINL